MGSLKWKYHVIFVIHDDVIKWKHFPRYWPFVRGIHRSPVNSPHKGQWRGALMFSLICVWINVWVNNREAGDLICHRAHYGVIVMWLYRKLSFLLRKIYSGHWVNRNKSITKFSSLVVPEVVNSFENFRCSQRRKFMTFPLQCFSVIWPREYISLFCKCVYNQHDVH